MQNQNGYSKLKTVAFLCPNRAQVRWNSPPDSIAIPLRESEVLRPFKLEVVMSPKDKAFLHALYQKHYGKGSKVKKENAKITKVIKEKKALATGMPQIQRQDALVEANASQVGREIPLVKEETRAALMQQAKEKGIKYFRILSKQELARVLTETLEEVNRIIEGAKKRWQAGWNKKEQQCVVKIAE